MTSSCCPITAYIHLHLDLHAFSATFTDALATFCEDKCKLPELEGPALAVQARGGYRPNELIAAGLGGEVRDGDGPDLAKG